MYINQSIFLLDISFDSHTIITASAAAAAAAAISPSATLFSNLSSISLFSNLQNLLGSGSKFEDTGNNWRELAARTGKN